VGGSVKEKIKLNSAQLELELGLSLAKIWIKFKFLVVPPSSINLDPEIDQAITHIHRFL
jgi:hypothetical protein